MADDRLSADPQAAEHDAAQARIRLLLGTFPETVYVATAIDEDGTPYCVQPGDGVTEEEVIATGARTSIGHRTPRRRNGTNWDLRMAAASLGIVTLIGRRAD